jgi:hypothetical protein
MGRWLLAAVLGLVGCQAVGPVQRFNQPPQRVDGPGLAPFEQQQRGRARLAYPENNKAITPPLDYGNRLPDP